ncbi:putative monooxygenase [Crepidotus variabilis]|uniref:Monooxygenase n=1 Tax=Crepidotus variabilis TaxID=179855 RepID=A0A9P6JPY2_9AGAR|nr:putative monooxygenase [Crepidotus variabilis]
MQEIILASILGLVVLRLLFHTAKKRREPLPPGPPKLPLLGNAHQTPKTHLWLKFAEWGKIYGDIIHLRLLGTDLIVLNSHKLASDLLDKRASISSDRPVTEMYRICGYDDTFLLMPYGESFRTQRRYMATEFSPQAVFRYHKHHENEARSLARNILRDPESIWPELRVSFARMIYLTTYGYRPETVEDHLLKTSISTVQSFVDLSKPGKYLVDLIPLLRYMPRWMPGTGFLHTADYYRNMRARALWGPYRWWKDHIDSPDLIRPNLCTGVFEKSGGKMSEEDEYHLASTAFIALSGGLDSIYSTVVTFFLNMLLHPEIQRKAQAEIDALTRQRRLPTVADRPQLPYTRSVLTEVLRWAPPGPTGFPHFMREDDIFNGYFIPKNSIVMANLWNIMRDPVVYPDPHTFNPERYGGDDNEMNKVNNAFGYGRRSCPGQYFAHSGIFAVISTVLATCDILPFVDEAGNTQLPDVEYSGGFISAQKPFTLRVKPRSAHLLEILGD